MYQDQNELEIGAMGAVVWTWPWQVGIPTFQDLTNVLFPRPLVPFTPHWMQGVLNKWNGFADRFRQRFEELAGEEIEDEEAYQVIVLEAAGWAASECGFDLWDEVDGLPSMPVYVPVSGGN